MRKSLIILLNIVILAALLALPSLALTKKRILTVENDAKSLNKENSSKKILSKTISISSDQGLFLKNKHRINAIFLGTPGQGNSAPNLTDTLMVMSIDNITGKGFLISIPRDLLVKIPDSDYYSKINSLYHRKGMEAIEFVLTKITGLTFDYWAVIDLSGVKKVIDQLGGIDIEIEEKIYDPAFPGPDNSYQLFTLNPGKHRINGETALKYIRTRHNPTGDFARMKRQQKVLIAIKKQITSLNPIWDSKTVIKLFNTIKNNFQTNLSVKNIKAFWKSAKNIDLEKISFKVLNPETNLIVPSHSILGGQRAYVLKPKAGLNNYEKIHEYINNLITAN